MNRSGNYINSSQQNHPLRKKAAFNCNQPISIWLPSLKCLHGLYRCCRTNLTKSKTENLIIHHKSDGAVSRLRQIIFHKVQKARD